MTKWLIKKGLEGYYRHEVGSGYYEFNSANPRGTAVPDDVAEALLSTGLYEELNTDWHKERKEQVDGAKLKDFLKSVPNDIKKFITVKEKEEEPKERMVIPKRSKKR